MTTTTGFQCSVCSKWHDGLPDLMLDVPEPYLGLSEAEKKVAKLSDDLCVIPNAGNFVRGLIELPIIKHEGNFGISAWVSLAPRNFNRYVDLYTATDVTGEGPWFAWFCNSVPGYPETFGLKSRLHLRAAPKSPLIELEPTNHPLAVHQRTGISMAEIMKLVGPVLHRGAT